MDRDPFTQVKERLQDPHLTRTNLIAILQDVRRDSALCQSSRWHDFLLRFGVENLLPLLRPQDVQERLLPLFEGPYALAAALQVSEPHPQLLAHSISTTISSPQLNRDAIQLLCSIPDRLASIDNITYAQVPFFERLASSQQCTKRRELLEKLIRLGHADVDRIADVCDAVVAETTADGFYRCGT